MSDTFVVTLSLSLSLYTSITSPIVCNNPHALLVINNLIYKMSSTLLEDEKPTTAGELKLSDLPPLEDLKISVPADSLIKIGKVLNVVDVLVVVESIQKMPPLDIDTILFKSDGEPLGAVFDVFGPIKEPHYTIRFNRPDQVKEKNIELNMPVFFVPQSERKITKFAFIEELKKIKGTDASWENDNEPPECVLEYSDDEEEKQAKSNRKHNRDKDKVAKELI